MRNLLRKLFAPLLKYFETGEGAYSYKDSHRIILIVVGGLFLFLSVVSTSIAISTANFGGLLPGLVFFLVGLTCEVVGLLGSDRAVSKIWGSK